MIPLPLRDPERNPGVYPDSSPLLGASQTTAHRVLTCEMQAKPLPQRFFLPQRLWNQILDSTSPIYRKPFL